MEMIGLLYLTCTGQLLLSSAHEMSVMTSSHLVDNSSLCLSLLLVVILSPAHSSELMGLMNRENPAEGNSIRARTDKQKGNRKQRNDITSKLRI